LPEVPRRDSLQYLCEARSGVDEIWSFVGAKQTKQKNVTQQMADERVCGGVWTFVAIEAQKQTGD
jgi:hypothetical protein